MGSGVKKLSFLLVSGLPSPHECPLPTRKMRSALPKPMTTLGIQLNSRSS